jgi:preprotein translocase subunit YajC
MYGLLAQGGAAAPVAADAAAMLPGGAQGGIASFLPFILVLGIFYFLLIRPQQRKFKDHQTMVSALKKGDKVITGGGIIGTITKSDKDDTVTVQIAEGVSVQVARATIVGMYDSAQQPAPARGKPAAKVANDN